MGTFKTKLVQIGNSRGIRIPKALIDQTGLEQEIEIVAQNDQLVVRSIRKRREGWDERFKTMADNKDDQLLDEPRPTQWDDSEWTW